MGATAAWAMLAVYLVAHFCVSFASTDHGFSRLAHVSFGDAIIIWVAIPVLALVHRLLPRGSRRAFVSTMLICAGVAVMMWGATCAVALSEPPSVQGPS